MADKKRGLGKGLGALISTVPSSVIPPSPAPSVQSPVTLAPVVELPPIDEGARILYLDPQAIKPNPKQPRTIFKEEALEELAESIRQDGVQEPIIVRKAPDGTYELVSGERRVRASIMAEKDTVPAICREISDSEMLKLALIENIQREDLNPIELGVSYQALINEFGWTQEQLAEQVGKKRTTVANILRLLNLPKEVQEYVMDGRLSAGHARALLSLDTPEQQSAKARAVIMQGLSVRSTEKITSKKVKKTADHKPKDPNITILEDELRSRLGTKVTLHLNKQKSGSLEIEFYNYDDLDRILDIIRGKKS